jgi:hypothetical protein
MSFGRWYNCRSSQPVEYMVDEVDLVFANTVLGTVAAKSALKLSYMIQYHTMQLQHKGLVSLYAPLFVVIRLS